MIEMQEKVTQRDIPPRGNGEKGSKRRGIERNIIDKCYVQLLQR